MSRRGTPIDSLRWLLRALHKLDGVGVVPRTKRTRATQNLATTQPGVRAESQGLPSQRQKEAVKGVREG